MNIRYKPGRRKDSCKPIGKDSLNLVNLFKHSADTTVYMEGSTLFEQGDSGKVMYVVLEGKVEVQVQLRPVFMAGPGDILGEMALIDAGKRSATAIAKTDCRVVAVDEKQFLYMINQTPYFALHVMRVLADRLRKMDNRVSY